MQRFVDSTNFEWVLDVNLAARKRVQKETGFDLLAVTDPQTLQRLDDPQLLVDVIHSLCHEQTAKLAIDAEAFAARMGGDVLDKASDALMLAIADFFPQRRRTLLTAAIHKGRMLQEQAVQMGLKEIEALTLESLIDVPPKKSSADSPASSESTQAEVN